jgi:hypothetical protein
LHVKPEEWTLFGKVSHPFENHGNFVSSVTCSLSTFCYLIRYSEIEHFDFLLGYHARILDNMTWHYFCPEIFSGIYEIFHFLCLSVSVSVSVSVSLSLSLTVWGCNFNILVTYFVLYCYVTSMYVLV